MSGRRDFPRKLEPVVTAAGVTKGSFFNHLVDKRRFASAVAHEIRLEIEQWVARINNGVPDPLERLAGGMIAAAAYARATPRRTVVLTRILNGMSLKEHPINAGLLDDLRAAIAEGLIELPSEQAGVLFWLGSGQILMVSIVERGCDLTAAHDLLLGMLQLGLRGFAAGTGRIAELIEPASVLDKFALLERMVPA
jgi:AcrR family transcriptional regulator